MYDPKTPTNIVIVGASGDLARKKLLPGLFALFCNGLLPDMFTIYGFARSARTDAQFREFIASTLTLRYEPEPSVCDIKIGQFLRRCHYHTGHYDSVADFAALAERMARAAATVEGLAPPAPPSEPVSPVPPPSEPAAPSEPAPPAPSTQQPSEPAPPAPSTQPPSEPVSSAPPTTPTTPTTQSAPPPVNLLFYMAIPPDVFLTTARSIAGAGLTAYRAGAWTRVVVEKPFGRDAASSAELTRDLGAIFAEEQTYRIDHYLGKEVIQNLLILRFGNRIFEPIWNRNHIESISIAFSERIGVEGRAGYFDSFGIIRDVLQNHLLQAMALVAMEQPIRLDAFEIAEEKTKLLRAVQPIAMDELVTGQYTAALVDGQQQPGYLDDPEIPADSMTETYARATLHIHNPRWHGVPFHLSAGKALDTQKTEITIRFLPLPYALFPGVAANSLVIRVQPNEAVELRVNNKVPGMRLETTTVGLDMLYHQQFTGQLPEAYERLLLDVLRGDRSLFIQQAELAAAWAVVTPVLQALESRRIRPKPYPFGSAGP